MHQGIEPIKERKKDNFRCVVYVCMTPRSLCNNSNLNKKISAFNNLRMTTHWPHKVKLFSKLPQTYGKPIIDVPNLSPPILTDLGKKLVGF